MKGIMRPKSLEDGPSDIRTEDVSRHRETDFLLQKFADRFDCSG